MVNTENFYNYLLNKGMTFFAGVPDSLLKNFCSCIKDKSMEKDNIITANEGNAVAMVAGRYLSTGKIGVVYMQNSGIGNTVNPLLSLTDEKVYKIPMLLLVGWRGEPGVKDEPQHAKQGEVTISLFETMGIKTIVLGENYQEQLDYCYDYMIKEGKSIALIVKKDTFTQYKSVSSNNKYSMTREQSLDKVISLLSDDDFVVSTTGKTSREIFEIREKNNQSHTNDFLTVGSMGHTSSIAYGVAAGTNKNVYCIDGDGSFLMHMGSFAVIGKNMPNNMKYILINNGVHESVGGQPTVAFDIDVKKILEAVGFNEVIEVEDEKEIENAICKQKNSSKIAIIIYTKPGSRDDLGRPTISPVENKTAFMKKISE